MFKIQVDIEGELLPMDAKKFLDDGDPVSSSKHMADALFQRLMIQVHSYSLQNPQGEDVDPAATLSALEKSESVSKIENIYTMTHIIHVNQL